MAIEVEIDDADKRHTVGDEIDIAATSVASGLVGLTLIAFCSVTCVVEWALRPEHTMFEKVTRTLAAGVIAVLEYLSLCLIYRKLRGRPPAPVLVTLALSQPRWIWPLRPLAATWWLGHYLILVLGVATLLRDVKFPDVSTYVDAATVVLLFIIYLVGSASCNAFLMLFFSALARSPNFLNAVHRLRWTIDIAVAAGIMFVPSIRHWNRL